MTARITFPVILSLATVAAVQSPVDLRAIDEAVTLGKTALDRQRVAFHAPYRLAVSRPPVDYVDVITPYRRIVLTAEQKARAGDRSFGQRQVLADPGLMSQELELRVELTFHPLNTFVGVPEYTVALVGAGGTRIDPRTFSRTPRYTPRVEGEPNVTAVPGAPTLPGTSQPIIGGTVAASFDLGLLNPTGFYELLIAERNTEVSRVRLDLARLR